MVRFFSGATAARRVEGFLVFLAVVGGLSIGTFGNVSSLPDADGAWQPSAAVGRAPTAVGTIEIRGTGELSYDPSAIKTLRPDIFRPGQFSVFDVLVHLAEAEQIELEYRFDPDSATHVITSMNGLEGWWFDAHYEGGSFDQSVVRMDQFPVKDGMNVILYLEDPARLDAIERHFRDEVARRASNRGRVIVPEVAFRSATAEVIFRDVVVNAHDARPDVFQPGVVTMLDVLLSLGEAGALDSLGLEWRADDEMISVIDGYYAVSIASGDFRPEATGSCTLTHQVQGEIIGPYLTPHTHTTSHVHLTADLELLVSPESIEWLWICL